MATTDRVDSTLSPRRRRMAQSRQGRRRRPLALVIAGALLLSIVAFLGVGYYITFISPPQQVVANINGVKFTLGDMETIIKANAAFRAQTGSPSGLSTFPFQVLDNLVDGELIKQAAPELGLRITAEEIDARLRENFYPDVPVGQDPSDAQLEREYTEAYLSYLAIARYSEKTYRDIILGDLIRVKARDTFSERVPAIEEQVYVEWILINQERDNPLQTVESLREQLAEGTEFGVLAQQFNDEDRYADLKGVVGWVPRGAFPRLDETLFSIEHDTASEPLFGDRGYYLLRVTDGPETREVTEEMREALKTSLFNEWISGLRNSSGVDVSFGSVEYEWLVRRTREAVPLPTAEPGLQG
ncbi:MAG: SurA N-terminal domain-containing protein [Chloroflexi bacterium]|nr:SurA N-terminal domain-containing protein [Chloroflexota bacterium]